MARGVGDVIAVQIGLLSVELANMTARAEKAEEALALTQKAFDALKAQTAPKEPEHG